MERNPGLKCNNHQPTGTKIPPNEFDRLDSAEGTVHNEKWYTRKVRVLKKRDINKNQENCLGDPQ